MNSDRLRVVTLLIPLALTSSAAHGQQIATGTPPFSSFSGGSFDTINMGNLNVHLGIPVVTKAGRGLPFYYYLSYDSTIWFSDSSSGVATWAPVTNWGWRAQTDAATGYIYYSTSTTTCYYISGGIQLPGGSTSTYSNWIYYDASGTSHTFAGSTKVVTKFSGTSNTCPASQTTSLTATAKDDAGYTLKATGASGYVIARNGTQFNPLPINAATGAGTVQDRNGNQLSVSSSGVFTDTLNTTALTITGTAKIGTSSSPTYYTYTGESGSEKVTVTYKQYSVRAAFGCTSPNAFGPTNEYLVDRVTLPDASYYSFSYELDGDQVHFPGTVTARIASVSLPTGGTIQYTYTGGNNGIFCIDGTTAGFSRHSPDGTSTYVRTRANSANVGTTTVTDGANNLSTYSFYEPYLQYPYEVERQVNTGGSSLLETVITCYNGQSPSSCATTPTAFTSISRITRYTEIPNASGVESEADESYNGSGLLTEQDSYDFGSVGTGLPGSVLRKQWFEYGTWNPSTNAVTALGNNILDLVGETCTENSSNAEVTCRAFNRDANGNALGDYQDAGAYNLAKHYTYNSTGTVATFTDVNGDAYSYSYGSCAGAWPTSVSEPGGLSRSMTWDCNGGVLGSVTDEAGGTTTIAHSGEYFWRPSSMSDAMTPANIMTFSYTPTSTEGVMNFGSSTVDNLVTFDTLGRTHVNQRRQDVGSSYFDTVETDYNSDGQVSRVTMPWQGTAGQTSLQASATTYTYDGMGRVLTVTDGGGGQIQHIYTNNRYTATLSPTPTGETNKSRDYQYDGLGRIINICEGTSGTAGGTCGFDGWAGFWTEYGYDTLGNLTNVTQNAQSSTPQTRTYGYDPMSRLTYETNPESGTTHYTYDKTQTGAGAGDLYTKADANNVTITYTYGAFHRLLTANAGGTSCRNFLYDHFNAQTGATYVDGRLAEAYTDACGSNTATTEYFSYDADGRTTDLWETTPNHNTTPFHITSQYFPNGGINTLAVPGAPSMTYGVDGEGRPSTVTASSGQNPVTAASYYTYSNTPASAGLLASVTYGSGDSDTFSYDSATGRMTQYQFSVNGSNITGALTWNPNGTLQQLAITDPFKAANTQTCAYAYDPMTRLSSVNCGSVWSQSFTYDFAGNLKKSGSLSFQPIYTDANGNTNNRYQSGLPGLLYDNDGNVTNDSFYTYSWDAFGKPTTIGGITAVYDAFGRLVEENNAGAYTQFVYAPFGAKVAVWRSGLSRTYIPLPGGGTFNSIGSANYFHPNWLGSALLTTSTTRTVGTDRAYAPYGELYANMGSAVDSFAGSVSETQTNLYDAVEREYHSSQGRWISPDPAGLGAVDLTNPQSWNRYAYVGGNPLSFVDPLGLRDCLDLNGDKVPCNNNSDPNNSEPTRAEGDDPRVDDAISPEYSCGFGLGLLQLSFIACPGLSTQSSGGGGGAAANNGQCPAVPQAPPGADVNRNIKTSRWMQVVTYTDPPVSLYAFDQMVGNKKPWDYKQQGWTLTDTGQLGPSPYQDFGNFNFGATGAAWGIPLNVLQRGAGYAQVKAGTSTPEWGHWYQGPPYGDDPADQAQIAAGYQYYQNGCYKKK